MIIDEELAMMRDRVITENITVNTKYFDLHRCRVTGDIIVNSDYVRLYDSVIDGDVSLNGTKLHILNCDIKGEIKRNNPLGDIKVIDTRVGYLGFLHGWKWLYGDTFVMRGDVARA